MTLDKLPIGKPAVILTVGGEGDLRCHLLDMAKISILSQWRFENLSVLQ